jgi:hypothetical protein
MEESKDTTPKQPIENIPEEIFSSEENISSENEMTVTTNTENQNDMEVHHHAHNPAEPHHKKNWKAYFWEFLMLFLAVFCGFLAEYQLEHKIERDRGNQYTYSFYEDLVTDSSYFNFLYKSFDYKLAALQDLSPCFDSLLKNQPTTNCLRTIMQNSNAFADMTYTERTLMQLKNAGGLRLLKKEDADSILLYDNLLRDYKTAETTGFQNAQNDLRETSAMIRDYGKWKDTIHSPRVFAIYGNNKELLNKYFNQLAVYLNYCKARLTSLQKIIIKNAELIKYFKAKYHYEENG